MKLARFPTPVTVSIDRVLAQRVATVSRILASLVVNGPHGGANVVIAEREVWPSSESESLWRTYCDANQSRIDASSGAWMLVYGPSEREHLVALLMLVVLFGWGVVVASAGGESCFSLNHDGHVSIWSMDVDSVQAAAEELGRRA